ncbi:glutamate decarboxylase [Actinokineospora sp. UTMC 2448]|uniref:glutamate decarboxylase n=1 Tax=Actinokineospora sp. UTMC 2448 TaxID=2268449 RepID=UPI002164E13A|nr:glutamate decarboxylase [Actinokineospora sp. UTMC 2448]UVS79819.1 Glutamate decarboxylase [Actinokineospora sp. UTMC 2448]
MSLQRAITDTDELQISPVFAQRIDEDVIPRGRLPESPMPAAVAAGIIRSRLLLDGRAALNLATFCTTAAEPELEAVYAETAAINLMNREEYPASSEIEQDCINALAGLWHDDDGRFVGCSTSGSSEAAMLAGLAMLRRWRERGGSGVPNLVFGTHVHVCWPKFCNFWDVEARTVPLAPNRTTLDPTLAAEAVDGNTIGVVGVLGSTQDGRYDPIERIAAKLDALADSGGPDVPLHVDAASGGFFAPFVDTDIRWDFELPRVVSINASGHKFGLVYPGAGWCLWRDPQYLPQSLVFDCNVLGGHHPTFTLNFSRPASGVIAQYYQFLRNGMAGFRMIAQRCQDTARHIAAGVRKLDLLELVADGEDLPVVTFRMRDPEQAGFTVYHLSEALKADGWHVPAYSLPPDLEHVDVIRVVCRQGFTVDLASRFLRSLATHIERLSAHPFPLPEVRNALTFKD